MEDLKKKFGDNPHGIKGTVLPESIARNIKVIVTIALVAVFVLTIAHAAKREPSPKDAIKVVQGIMPECTVTDDLFNKPYQEFYSGKIWFSVKMTCPKDYAEGEYYMLHAASCTKKSLFGNGNEIYPGERLRLFCEPASGLIKLYSKIKMNEELQDIFTVKKEI